jgi:hypothetical protein
MIAVQKLESQSYRARPVFPRNKFTICREEGNPFVNVLKNKTEICGKMEQGGGCCEGFGNLIFVSDAGPVSASASCTL